MRDFFKEYKWNGKNFLILGKGPSLDDIDNHNISDYLTIGLNHVCRDRRVHIAHIIDWDVVAQLGEKLYTNCDYLVMPYYPHVGWRANPFITLNDICKSHTIISKMHEEGRVFGYNLSTIKKKIGDSPVVQARYYSAEAAVSLLANLGVRTIRTLGIDGGNLQSKNFSDLTNYNKDRGYDLQWKGIRKTIQSFGVDFGPIQQASPIRVFIGAGQAQLIPALVLKHSILKHATMSVDVTIMSEWKHHMPKDKRNWPRTPFSFQRFMIPEKINGGMGIYMDSDMIVFGDVKEIWTEPTHEGLLTMRNDDIDKHRAKFAVCRYDGALYHPTIKEIVDGLDSGKWSYEDVVFDFKHEVMGIRDGFNPYWNDLESYTEGKTKLLHYTEMWRQPWHADPDHELGYLWFNELKESVEDGSISKDLIEEHVNKKWLHKKCIEVLNDYK